MSEMPPRPKPSDMPGARKPSTLSPEAKSVTPPVSPEPTEPAPHVKMAGALEAFRAQREAVEAEERKAARAAETLATFDEELATDPRLGLMNDLAREIATLRAEGVDVTSKEDTLNDLLALYESSDDYDESIADLLIDRTQDPAIMAEAKSKAKRRRDVGEPPADFDDEDEEEPDYPAAPVIKPPKVSAVAEPIILRPMPMAPVAPTTTSAPTVSVPVATPPVVSSPTPKATTPSTPSAAPGEKLIREWQWLVANSLTAFSDLKDKLANSKLAEWTKDKLAGPENKVRRRIVFGAVGLVALAGAAIAWKYGFSSGGGDKSVAPSGSVPVGEYNAPPPPIVELFSEAAHTVHAGEGWLETLNDMGFTDQEAWAKLPKILNSTDPGLQEWVYQMPDGNPGISHAGQLPDDVLKLIKNL